MRLMCRKTNRVYLILSSSWPALIGWSVALANAWTLWLVDRGHVEASVWHWLNPIVWLALVACVVGTALLKCMAERLGCAVFLLNVSGVFALFLSAIVT